MRACLSWVLAFSVLACGGEATPTGEVLLDVDFTEGQGGPPPGVEGEPVRTQPHIKLRSDESIELELALDVIEAKAKGARYLHGVKVVDAGGAQLSAAVASGAMPANLGTHEAPVASFPIVVTWQKTEGCGRSFGQSRITLRADGKVEK